MGFRKFVDRNRQQWEIRDLSRSRWEFSPAGDNRLPAREVEPPGYEQDPYELSQEELQALLDASTGHSKRATKNPFGDS
ncbi:MAG TPA: hypothetical protein VIP80_07660 [Gemmatimonadales bacterium]|jgi:hypothetical protein